MPRHRHQEFIRFLKHIDRDTPAMLDLHLIVDNYSTHKSPLVKRWLARHKRFHLHFVPTSSSWLNMVERWFGQITQKRIRRGTIGQSARTGGPPGSMYPQCPNVRLEEHDVFTNAGPTCALRAPGHPQGAFGLECAMDEFAHRLGMDPLEFRRANDTHPFRKTYYDVGAKAIGWERRNRVPGATAGPKKRGIGMAHGNWYVLFREAVTVEVRVHKDGSVELFHGAQDIGTGIRTALAVIAAEELGLRPTDITAHVGDTQYAPGGTSGGSTTTNSSGPAAEA